ncbi:MAG TPA: hypothetical protein VN664_07200 [Burkholderiales bacterium]|nr:hypothetical protein [Burkholderiales bacterium]
MNSNLSRWNMQLRTPDIMRYTVVLAVLQILCVVLFAGWVVSL